MTLRDFLDASYALLVDSFLSVAPNRVDLLSAVDKVDGMWAKPEVQIKAPGKKPQPTPIVKTQPAALMSMLPGGKMPG